MRNRLMGGRPVTAEMWAMPVIAMRPFRQIRSSFARTAISTPVSPFAQGSLNEAFGFTIGARRVERGEDVPQPPAPADRDERQRAKHLGVVGHEAADPHPEVVVVARGMVEKRRRAALPLIGKHLGEAAARVVVDGDERRFIDHTAEVMAGIFP